MALNCCMEMHNDNVAKKHVSPFDMITLLYLIPKSQAAQKVTTHLANGEYVIKHVFPGHQVPQDILAADEDDNASTRPNSLVEMNGPLEIIRLGLDSPVKNEGRGFVFGRGNRNAVDILMSVGDSRISSSHFRIYLDPKRSMIMVENESSNGLSINHERIFDEHRTLFHGALIECGSVAFEISIPNRTAYIEEFEARIYSYMERVFGEDSNRVCEVQTRPLELPGPYLITGEQVGEGTFGTVHRLVRNDSDVAYAAKQIKTGSLGMVAHEVRMMKQCKHRHIVNLIEVIVSENAIERRPWIIMEFVPHGTLLVLAETQELSRLDITNVLGQLLLAVRYMHSKSITHRDIKPENILVETKEPLFIKLSDFGLSTQKTGLETRCGTPGYAAPELFAGVLNYTNAVDIWSVGAVIWNTLRHFKDIMNLPIKEYYDKTLSAEITGLGRGGGKLLHSMLSHNPAERPTAEECLCDPLLQVFKESDRDNLSMLYTEWFSKMMVYGEAPLRQWLKLGDICSQTNFSAPYKFYQNRLVERYGPSVYNLPRLISPEYGIQNAQGDAKRVIQDLQKMGSNNLHQNALAMLILLERVPYHPQPLSVKLINHFRRLACALAICILMSPDKERLDFHNAYRLRPEYRCWFYMPLVFSGVGNLEEEGKKKFMEMKLEVEKAGNAAGTEFLNSLGNLYEDAKAAVSLDGENLEKDRDRRAVRFAPVNPKSVASPDALYKT